MFNDELGQAREFIWIRLGGKKTSPDTFVIEAIYVVSPATLRINVAASPRITNVIAFRRNTMLASSTRADVQFAVTPNDR